MSSYQISLNFENSKKSLPVYQSKDYDSLYSMGGLGIKVVRERTHLEEKVQVTRPADLMPVLQGLYKGEQREFFYSILMDARNNIDCIDLISIGSLNASLVHPREVFKLPIILGAASIVCTHNHPSGDCCPSKEDVDLTRRLRSCADLLGIEILDHIIFAPPNKYLSMKEASMF